MSHSTMITLHSDLSWNALTTLSSPVFAGLGQLKTLSVVVLLHVHFHVLIDCVLVDRNLAGNRLPLLNASTFANLISLDALYVCTNVRFIFVSTDLMTTEI